MYLSHPPTNFLSISLIDEAGDGREGRTAEPSKPLLSIHHAVNAYPHIPACVYPGCPYIAQRAMQWQPHHQSPLEARISVSLVLVRHVNEEILIR